MSRPEQSTATIGDIVVTMSYPGLFAVLEITGDDVTIGNAEGQKHTVRLANVRRIQRTSDTPP